MLARGRFGIGDPACYHFVVILDDFPVPALSLGMMRYSTLMLLPSAGLRINGPLTDSKWAGEPLPLADAPLFFSISRKHLAGANLGAL